MKFLIVNADDLGYGAGVNRGIAEAIDAGIVTSASLMVNTPGAPEGARIARQRPSLSVGLHVNVTNEAQRLVEFDDPDVLRGELERQLARFLELIGRPPTHLDSHQHVHRRRPCLPVFLELAREQRLPMREQPPVVFKGGFYAQWEYGVSDPSKVSAEALERILREELTGGVYELAVHPGYFDPAADYVYHQDRELELRTLCDPRLRPLLRDAGVDLISYHQLAASVAALRDGA